MFVSGSERIVGHPEVNPGDTRLLPVGIIAGNMTLSPGTELGPYQITAVLGAGSMGEVYRARDARLGSDVANQNPAPGRVRIAREKRPRRAPSQARLGP